MSAYLTPSEIAEYLRWETQTRRRIRDRIRRMKIPHITMGLDMIIDKEEFKAWFEETTGRPCAIK